MAELKPCPKCGGTGKLHKRNRKFYVECDGDCWTQTKKYTSANLAIRSWNEMEKEDLL